MKRAFNTTRNSELATRNCHIVWLAALAAYILAGTALVPFHGDEATQIYMSRDYVYLFLDHDLNRVLYHPDPASPTEQHLRLLNGTLPKYLIGLAWHAGGLSPADLNEQWDWGADWYYNQQTGHAPTPERMQLARWSSALLLAAGVVPMFWLGRALGGTRAAYLASLYYALHPALLLNGRRAMMEGSVTLFSLLVVLAGVWWMKALTPSSSERGESRIPSSTSTTLSCRVVGAQGLAPLRKHPSFSSGRCTRWLAAAMLGITAGLALASKHTALFTVAGVFGTCGGCVLWQGIREGFKPLAREKNNPLTGLVLLAFSGIVAAAVFLALNPAWWSAPLQMPGVVLHLRAELLQTQVAVFGGYASLPEQIGGFWRQVFLALPQYYEVVGWETYIGDQIARYEASPWRGVSVGGSAVGGIVLAVMLVVGAWALVRGRGSTAARRVVGVWAAVVMAATLVLTPLEWQRYYLPVYPAVGLLAAVGVDYALQKITSRQDARKETQGRV